VKVGAFWENPERLIAALFEKISKKSFKNARIFLNFC
jgi:hypothetical protein